MINIRVAEKNDINKIWELGKEVGEFETAENIVIFWPVRILNNCINKEDVMILVVEFDKEIIGFSISNINKSLCKAELENIYIKNEYRNNGYGSSLLNKTLEELKNRNVENVCVMASDIVEFFVKYSFTKGNKFYWMDLALSERFKK
jgi:N-acetylglutamate synthase and related acetyltransferases